MAELRKLLLIREYAQEPEEARSDLARHFSRATCTRCNPVYDNCYRYHTCVYELEIMDAVDKEINNVMTHQG